MAGILLLALLQLLVLPIFVSANPLSMPGCSDTCGTVRVPYPFGMSPGCYYRRSFHITCNNSFNPPKPFFYESKNVSILDISTESSELRMETTVSRDCYDKLGKLMTNESNPYSYTSTYTTFPLSSRNKFVAVGCDTLGLIGGDGERDYATGCVALCNKTADIVNGSCSGIGCCQMDVPKGVLHYLTIVQSLDPQKNHSSVHDFNPCGFAFVAEKGAYSFSSSDLMNLQKRETFPVVLDWSIGNLTCQEAKTNLTGYACKATNSECLNSINGPGYRCKCLPGFEGNPYLLHGCHDIDECERFDPCNIKCDNLEGGYQCSPCPKGFKGDGKRRGSGCSPIDNNNNKFIGKLSIMLGVSTGFLLVLVGSSWIYWGAKKRNLIKLKDKFFQQNGGLLLRQQLLAHPRGSAAETTKIFTADELNKATNNFDQSRVIGQGGYGTVYKGILTNNNVVAVKKSRIGDQSQIEQFINEVVVLSQINHRNVVKLLGCCLETEVPLLVYEFITNGSLSDHIYRTSSSNSLLSWEMRLKIVTETAGAIAYLHSSVSMPIIHRDIKTANILLDENYTAKVSDFGASRLVPIDQTQLTTLVQGTLGYLDPEYFHTSQLTEKSDVYSFGVVLAEMLTGEKALSFDRPEGARNLALYFASSMNEDRLLQILDKNLIVDGNSKEFINIVANLAKECLKVRGKGRPTMKEVASELDGLMHREMHPWGRDQVDMSAEEKENLLNSSNSFSIEHQDGFGGFSSITAARFESLNKEMLLSYRDGR